MAGRHAARSPAASLARDHSEYAASILSRPTTELMLMWDLGNIPLLGRVSQPCENRIYMLAW